MAETLKDIIYNSEDIFEIEVQKPDKKDKSTWKFIMKDPRWKDGPIDDYKFHMVHLRRNNTFFLAYTPYNDGMFRYFVDPKRAMQRKSVQKYINSLVDYSVYSNDISTVKDASSFKVTRREMQQMGIENFLDLCWNYRNYSAIGIGYTRNLRNLVVMDIDVDCTRQDVKEDLDNLLMKFASYNAMPDFYIFNHNSKHVQLQWLIHDFWYKNINQEMKDRIKDELYNDTSKNKEVNYLGTDFTIISDAGKKYRKFTLAMCNLVKRRKFGDPNFTFWKAKNPMCALMGKYGLELKMPYLCNNEIRYLPYDEMLDFFSSKDSRKNYYDEAPEMNELYFRTKDFMDPLMNAVTDKKAMKWGDGEEIPEKKKPKKETVIEDINPAESESESEGFGESRNTFVLNCTKVTTWSIAKEKGYKKPEHITSLPQEEFVRFRKEVYALVRHQFEEEDKKYKGFWPGTSNRTMYGLDEFQKTFNSGFEYAVRQFSGYYSDEDRERSLQSRHAKMDMQIMVVDKIRNENEGITRKELLKKVNRFLVKSGHKEISFGSLKLYLSKLNRFSDDDRQNMISEWKDTLKERKQRMDEAIEYGKNQKAIHVCKKRYETIAMDLMQ